MSLSSLGKGQESEGKCGKGWEEERSAYKAGRGWIVTSLHAEAFLKALHSVPKEQHVSPQKR